QSACLTKVAERMAPSQHLMLHVQLSRNPPMYPTPIHNQPGMGHENSYDNHGGAGDPAPQMGLSGSEHLCFFTSKFELVIQQQCPDTAENGTHDDLSEVLKRGCTPYLFVGVQTDTLSLLQLATPMS